ncbi:MAG: hypothetical protein ACT4NY_16075 [Pseudonocardiales bacterium]
MIVRTGIVDDAYITLTYARNLAFHLHWGLTPEQTANTATSPLNILVQGLLTAVLRRPVLALGVLFVLSNVAVAYALLRVTWKLGLPSWSALLGCALVLFNPLLDSAVGLEIALSAGVMALLLMAAVEGRPALFGLFAGLLVLTRFDLGIFAAVLFLGCGVLLRAWWKVLLAAVAVSLPWFAWSWIVLGSAVPDTMLIKAAQAANQPLYAFAKGPLDMYRGFPVMTVLSFVPAILGIVALLAWVGARLRKRFWVGTGPIVSQANGFHPVVLLGLGGILHYLAYSVLNAPLFHWYYSWSIISLTYLFALSAGALTRLRGSTAHEVASLEVGSLVRHRPALAVGVATALIAVAQVGYIIQHGVPWTQAAYNGNAATPAEYAAVGLGIQPLVGDRPVRSPGEIGTIAYFCDCEILDEFSDRGLVESILDRRKQHHGPLGRFLLDMNFHFRDNNLKPTQADYAIVYVKEKPTDGHYWPTTGPSWIGNGYDVLVPISGTTGPATTRAETP